MNLRSLNKKWVFFLIVFLCIFLLFILILISILSHQQTLSGEKTNLIVIPTPFSTSPHIQNNTNGAKPVNNLQTNLGRLVISYPQTYIKESLPDNPDYLGLIGPPVIQQHSGTDSSSDEQRIEFYSGPAKPNDLLDSFVSDRNTLRTDDDRAVLEEYTTFGNTPVYHEILKDQQNNTEESYLTIVDGQRILILTQSCDEACIQDLKKIVSGMQTGSDMTSSPNPATIKPTGLLYTQSSNISYSDRSQKQATFSMSTLFTSQPIPDCQYGPQQKNCSSLNPRTCIPWRESGVLAAFQAPTEDATLHAWYQDEHALTLGSGTVSQLTQSPDHVVNPNTGNPDGVDEYERPLRPVLFITDITNDPGSKSGDWEYGGTPHNPTEIFGTWKALNDNDPPQNGRALGPDSLMPPPPVLDKYVTEIRWNLDSFGLIRGHSYRLEFMVHDGDRGGDAGEKCASIQY